MTSQTRSKHAGIGVNNLRMSFATLTRSRISFRHEAPWMRLTARALLAGWLLPMLFALLSTLGVGVQPALAQDAGGQTVVVLDFATPNGVDPLLGRKAADALAVELQRTGEYTVVTRQDLQKAVGQQAGLQPPFNDTAQVRLAQAVGASSVFSGEVANVNVVPGQSARVRLIVRQLDQLTGDYINGTQNIESTEQKLTTVANEILVDEAINKAAFSAVRSMRQTALPTGAVLNTTRDDMELSIGTREGVSVGQRYTILRDVYNAARNVTERVKIGEVTIRRVEADQSTAVLSAGGPQGVRTGDRVRQIFVASQAPVSTSNGTGSSSPVTAKPARVTSGDRGIAKSGAAKGLLGIGALIALIGIAGFASGGSNSAPSVGQPFESNPYGAAPTAALTFNSTTTDVVGYLVFRGTNPNFAPAIQNLQSFLDARSQSAGRTITYSDPLITSAISLRQKVVITANNNGNTNNNNGNGNNNGNTGNSSFVSVTFTNAASTGTDNQDIQQQTATLEYTQRPLEIGTTYYYKIGRINSVKTTTTNNNNNNGNNNNGNNNNGNNNNGNNTGTTTTVTINLTQTPASEATGGYTPLLRPLIIASSTNPAYNLSNFSVRLNAQADINQLTSNLNYSFPINSNAATGADILRVQVSTSSNFSDASTFTSADTAPPAPNGTGDVVLDFGRIQIPGTTLGQFTNGTTPIYIRAQSRRSTDVNSVFRVSPTITVPASQVTDSSTVVAAATSASRFLSSAPAASGLSFGRGAGRGTSSVGVPNTRVGKPRD